MAGWLLTLMTSVVVDFVVMVVGITTSTVDVKEEPVPAFHNCIYIGVITPGPMYVNVVYELIRLFERNYPSRCMAGMLCPILDINKNSPRYQRSEINQSVLQID